MDAAQPVTALEALKVLWPILAGAGAAGAAVGGWVWSLSMRLTALDGGLATNRADVQRLQQNEREHKDWSEEQKQSIQDRVDELASRIEAHERLEDHAVGRVRREVLERQVAEALIDLKAIKEGMARIMAKIGA